MIITSQTLWKYETHDNYNSIKTDIVIYLNKYIKCKLFSIAHIEERGPEIILSLLYETDVFLETWTFITVINIRYLIILHFYIKEYITCFI